MGNKIGRLAKYFLEKQTANHMCCTDSLCECWVTRKVKYEIHIPKITFRFLLGVCKHTGQGWGVTFGANSRDFAPHNSLAQKVLAWRQKSNMRNLLFLRSCKRLEFLDAIYALLLLLIFLWRNYRCSTSAITFSSQLAFKPYCFCFVSKIKYSVSRMTILQLKKHYNCAFLLRYGGDTHLCCLSRCCNLKDYAVSELTKKR